MKVVKFLSLIALLSFAISANAAVWQLSCTLNGGQMVPPTLTISVGSGTFHYNDVTGELSTTNLTYTLFGSAPVPTFVFWRSAAIGATGPVIDLVEGVASPASFTFPLHPEETANVLAGNAYIEFFMWNPADNIRGQLGVEFMLPVELTNFSASVINGSVSVNWHTESEHGNQRFILERSQNASTFETIAEVQSQSVNGTSATPLNYNVVDARVENCETYTYRLSQQDIDGTVHTLREATITVNSAVSNPTGIITNHKLVNVYPNPFNPVATIAVDARSLNNGKVAVYNLLGKLVFEQALTKNSEQNVLFNATGLATGNYLVRLMDGPVTLSQEQITLLK